MSDLDFLGKFIVIRLYRCCLSRLGGSFIFGTTGTSSPTRVSWDVSRRIRINQPCTDGREGVCGDIENPVTLDSTWVNSVLLDWTTPQC